MSDSSRRKFLAAAGVGTAAGAVGVLSGGSASAAPATQGTARHAASSREPVVAFIEHPWSNQVRLMVGEREVVIDDRELAARILNAAGRK